MSEHEHAIETMFLEERQYPAPEEFAALNAGASPGAMGQTPDPVMNTIFALIDRATAPKSGDINTSEDSAVASAMEKEVEAVIKELSKRKK